MTATEELRRMLDERGVDYRVSATGYSIDIGPYTTAYANRSNTTLDVSLRQVTPEQAIAATLEACNCSNNCTNSERTWTCHDRGTFNSWGFFTCSDCSIVFPLDAVKEAPSIGRTLPPKYCPNCGRRIVGPTTNDVDAEVDA